MGIITHIHNIDTIIFSYINKSYIVKAMSQSATFIWERYNQHIVIQPKRQYLFYYRGCFCPPHGGHFDGAARYLKYPNVKMIIHQMGGQRHGVPTSVNRQIWNWYIDELLPDDRVDLVQYNDDNHDLPNNHRWIRKSDVVVIIRGDEVDDTKAHEQLDYRRWGSTIRRCDKYDINVVFIYDLRNRDKLSASAFIKDLIRYNQSRIRIEDLYQYLPKRLSTNTKRKIIHLLIQYRIR